MRTICPWIPFVIMQIEGSRSSVIAGCSPNSSHLLVSSKLLRFQSSILTKSMACCPAGLLCPLLTDSWLFRRSTSLLQTAQWTLMNEVSRSPVEARCSSLFALFFGYNTQPAHHPLRTQPWLFCLSPGRRLLETCLGTPKEWKQDPTRKTHQKPLRVMPPRRPQVAMVPCRPPRSRRPVRKPLTRPLQPKNQAMAAQSYGRWSKLLVYEASSPYNGEPTQPPSTSLPFPSI